MNMDSNRSNRQKGFTLTEVLVGLAIFAVIIIAALTMYDRSNRVFKRGVESADTQQNTRVAFEKMVSDLRMGGYDYDRDGNPALVNPLGWQSTVAYSSGQMVQPSPPTGRRYRAQNDGTSGVMQPVWPTATGGTVTEGTVPTTITWIDVTGPGPFQQPDEQFEYAHPRAITIRANFDFETDSARGNGREPNLESAEFPVVTTGNDEIVTYALVSDGGPNTDSINFVADINNGGAPSRRAYSGGVPERAVTIAGVDLAAGGAYSNPPYTLYRFHFADDGSVVRAPLAGNIRSLEFTYFNAPSNGTALVFTTATAGDDANRDQRGQIQAFGVKVVGMDAVADGNYVDPNETVASARNFRKYELSANIVPRNFGRRGSYVVDPNAPGPPVIETVCVGYCGIAKVTWRPAQVDATTGPVESYVIHFDTDTIGTWAFGRNVGLTTSAYVEGLTAGTTYFFAIEAVNPYGTAFSSNIGQANTINRTTPAPPSALSATGGPLPAGAADSNQTVVSWQRPSDNVAPNNTVTCSTVSPTTTSGATTSTTQVLAAIPPSELKGYKVWRSTDPTFNPSVSGDLVLDVDGTDGLGGQALTSVSGAGQVTLIDRGLPGRPMQNCRTYYYRVQAFDRCYPDTGTNNAVNPSPPPPNVSPASTIFPLVGTNGIAGQSTSAIPPEAPALNAATGVYPCPLNQCTVTLSWPKVTLDTASPTRNNIAIDEYRLTRVQKKNGIVLNTTSLPAITGAAAGPSPVTYTDSDPAVLQNDVDGQPFVYEYTATAVQCGVQSAPSGVQSFPPCGFTGAVSVDPAFDGAGTIGSPWVVSEPATIGATATASVAEIRAKVFLGSTLFADLGVIGSGTSASATWPPGTTDGVSYRVEATFVSAAGCVMAVSGYAITSPQSCCLIPDSVDSTVMTFGPGTRTVTVRLKNLCSNTLTLQPSVLRVNWTPTAGNQLRRVQYPRVGGGTVIDNVNDGSGNSVSTLPVDAVTTVGANSSNYVLTVEFSQDITASTVTGVCVTYRRLTVDLANQNCKIVPAPSALPNTCN